MRPFPRSASDGGAGSCDDACVQRLLPAPSRPLTDEELVEAYEFPLSRPCLRASFVMSLDGAVAGGDGNSRSIASASDRRVFSHVRLRADVVLVGAGTVRADRYGPSRLPIAIVTGGLDLAPDLPLFAEAKATTPRTLVFTSAQAAPSAPAWLHEHADVIACGDETVDLSGVIGELGRRGLGRIHCEGGPALLSALTALDLVDELLVSVSPLIVGAPPSEHLVSVPGGLLGSRQWRAVHVLAEDGTVFLRLRRS